MFGDAQVVMSHNKITSAAVPGFLVSKGHRRVARDKNGGFGYKMRFYTSVLPLNPYHVRFTLDKVYLPGERKQTEDKFGDLFDCQTSPSAGS